MLWALKQVKLKKTTGSDHVPTFALRDSSATLTLRLMLLFNIINIFNSFIMSLFCGKVPKFILYYLGKVTELIFRILNQYR